MSVHGSPRAIQSPKATAFSGQSAAVIHNRLGELAKHIHNLTDQNIAPLREETSWHGGHWHQAIGLTGFSDLLPEGLPPLTSNQTFKDELLLKTNARQQITEMFADNPELLAKVLDFQSLAVPQPSQNQVDSQEIINSHIEQLKNRKLNQAQVGEILDKIIAESDQYANDDDTAPNLQEIISKPMKDMTAAQKNNNFFIMQHLAQKLEQINDMDDMDALRDEENESKSELTADLLETYFVYSDVGDRTHQFINDLCDHMIKTDPEHKQTAQNLKASLAENGSLREKINDL